MALPFRFVASDMDGTLLSPDHVMSELTRSTLKTLVLDHGVTVILATGRNFTDVRIVAANLKKYIWGDAHPPTTMAEGATVFLVTSNGAVVHNGATEELVYQNCVNPALTEELYRMLPESEEIVNTNVYQYNDWICRIDWPEMLQVHKESGLKYKYIPSPPVRTAEEKATASHEDSSRGVADGYFTGVSKIFYILDDKSRMDQTAAQVRAVAAKYNGGDSISLTFSASDCLDVMAAGVTKGDGLQRLFATILPAATDAAVADAMKSTIAFGDGLNDQEMLTMVGKGCAMANSNPKLLEACPALEVVCSNGDDGVAHKLREVFQLDKM